MHSIPDTIHICTTHWGAQILKNRRASGKHRLASTYQAGTDVPTSIPLPCYNQVRRILSKDRTGASVDVRLNEVIVIRSVEVTRLRGIREGKLTDLTPLVVLVGPNGSGKSTILDALLIAANSKPPEALC